MDESNNLSSGNSEAASDALFAALLEGERMDIFSLNSIHFIGHSRGSVVISETTERLLALGRSVEHVTYLDAHDWGAVDLWDDWDVNESLFIDYPPEHVPNSGVVSWTNTMWSDSYFQKSFVDLSGREVRGTYETNLGSIGHKEVRIWYLGTIDGSSGDDAWYGSEYPTRTEGGYNYSRVGSLEKPSVTTSNTVDYRFNFESNGIFNGDFSRGESALPENIPGWSGFGGGGNGLIVSGRLVLNGFKGRFNLKHNRVYLPPNSGSISFNYRTVNKDEGEPPSVDKLRVILNSDVVIDNIWLNELDYDFNSVSFDVSAYANSVVTFEFEILKGGFFWNSEVWIDDIELQLEGTQNILPEPPIALSPVDDEIIDNLTPTFSWTVFEHGGDNENQLGYQLRIQNSDRDDLVVYNTGLIQDNSQNIHSYTPGGYVGFDHVTGADRVSESLEWNTHYFWQARYMDSGGDWSRWSNEDLLDNQDFYTASYPLLTVTPDIRNIEYIAGNTLSFYVDNGGSGTFNWEASVIEGGSWLSIISGSIGTNAGSIVLEYSQNNEVDTRIGSMRVTAFEAINSPIDVTVSQAGLSPYIVLTPKAVEFQANMSDILPADQSFSITNIGGATLECEISESINWLKVDQTSGSGNKSIINISSLTTDTIPGLYLDSIVITSTNAENSPQTLNVSYGIESPSAVFSKTNMGFQGIHLGASKWGDYDNDGDLDLLITGNIAVYPLPLETFTKLYRNEGGEFFTEINTTLFGTLHGSFSWGDYDNDGDLDILINGFTNSELPFEPRTAIYRNDNNDTFVNIEIDLLGIRGSVSWNDFDNDGDLDVLVNGQDDDGSLIIRLYKNEGNDSFINVETNLPATNASSIAWGDYNNDGKFDILLSGEEGLVATELTRIYKNVGDGQFVDIEAGLQDMSWSFVNWIDYDSDGDLDILVGGINSGTDVYTKIYRNDGDENFIDIEAEITPVWYGTSSWGDFDNDGDLDVIISGRIDTNLDYFTFLYRNDGNDVFTKLSLTLTNTQNGDIAWGDYDNDYDLDVLIAGETKVDFVESGLITYLFKNNNPLENTPPEKPADLYAIIESDTVKLNWSKAYDLETRSDGLTYNIRVGTSPGGSEVVSSHSNPTNGHRSIVSMGNTQSNNFYILNNLKDGTYYWSIQAIDNSFSGSEFAEERTFTVSRVDVSSLDAMIPTKFELTQNYPNPFNPVTVLRYALPISSNVSMVIYNLMGQEVIRWDEGNVEPGYYEKTWKGTNRFGNPVASGIYIYRLIAGDFIQTKKMVLLR